MYTDLNTRMPASKKSLRLRRSQEFVVSQDDAGLAFLEQALLDALSLAQAQGDVDAARSLSLALEKLRARMPTRPNEA